MDNMKKFLGLFLALFTVFSLAGCNKGEEGKTEANDIMSYSEFMTAESGEEVRIEGFIAAKQGWWDGAVTCYLTTDVAGEGYFVYGLKCTEEENNSTFKIGTYVQIAAKKTIYAGQHEIMGADITEAKVVETTKKQATQPIDLNDKLDSLFDYQNSYFTLTLDVKAYSFKGDEEGKDDLYFTLTNGTKDVACCVEFYLTGANTEVYKTVMSLKDKIGTSVTVTGYLYWWSNDENPENVKANGANPHIISCVINEK